MAPFNGQAPSLAATVITLATLGAIVFPLRVWTRTSRSSWGWDDFCMAVAILPFAGLSAVCLGGAFNGIGVDQNDLQDDEEKPALMWFWLFEIFWCMAVVPVKLSIALTIGRLGRIAPDKRMYIMGLYVLSGLLAAITLGGLFYIIFRCTPVSFAWDWDIPNGSCEAPEILAGIYYSTTAINILMDWICALLPILLLWSAPLEPRTKLSIGFLLSLGVLASITACVRQKYTAALTTSHNFTGNLGDLEIWGYAEIGIGFFVGSLSTLRPLFVNRRTSMLVSEDANDQELYELATEKHISLTPERLGDMSPVSREIENHVYELPAVDAKLNYHAH